MKPEIILMRQPNGKSSRVEVHYKENGGVDLVFARSSDGEILVMLPAHIVPKLRDALAKHLPEEALTN